MTMVGLPLILFGVEVGDTDMGDIEYLAIKEFGGKLRSDEGTLSVTGDLATLTANTGKDMYLASAKCIFYLNNDSSAISLQNEVQLSINTVIIERAITSYTVQTIAGGAVLTIEYEFKNIGRKVAAGEIIKLAVTTLDVDTDVTGFIECFEEDTGETPQIPPLNPV